MHCSVNTLIGNKFREQENFYMLFHLWSAKLVFISLKIAVAHAACGKLEKQSFFYYFSIYIETFLMASDSWWFTVADLGFWKRDSNMELSLQSETLCKQVQVSTSEILVLLLQNINHCRMRRRARLFHCGWFSLASGKQQTPGTFMY